MALHFPKRLRLLKPTEFRRVMAARTSAADGLLRLYGTANGLDHARLGLTVSRRLGGAVTRNRWKRAVREAFRLAQHDLPPIDLVCIPHAGAVADVGRIRESLPKLARQIAGRLGRPSPGRNGK